MTSLALHARCSMCLCVCYNLPVLDVNIDPNRKEHSSCGASEGGWIGEGGCCVCVCVSRICFGVRVSSENTEKMECLVTMTVLAGFVND